jgi:hypothetical protein
LASAVAIASTHPWLSAAAAVLGMIALRGCPTCWTIGLIQTVAAKIRGTPTDHLCKSGECSHDRSGGARQRLT